MTVVGLPLCVMAGLPLCVMAGLGPATHDFAEKWPNGADTG